ncbi:hypothetical protein QO058_21640 [Bosea vestrisii]|uniref:hypothetical protein n=1 Tax=Bosea vestrisii TaxID=151416 RepID=UPI0024DF393E|nr:hypothetical protein [Bosea vestrisii]WID95356.1 hypothetical protein QO058_21640 [Bosea vestrisii]
MPVELKDHRPRHAGRDRFRYDTAAAYEGADDLEDCNVCRFWLNGTVYVVIEDPSDGYCSSMCAIKVVLSAAMMNVFRDPGAVSA